MPKIELKTHIKSDLATCFDLATSIDLHKLSTSRTNEEAIAGRTKGLIRLNESVTWRATHFGVRQQLTTRITAYTRPVHFRDEQEKGIFRSLKHDHFFEEKDGTVIMTDVFEFESPFGIPGKLFNKWILINYLRNFLVKRNAMIKDFAESGKWKSVIEQ
jgi:ligand-binding SRPBCC domain-containing protein